MIDLLHAMAFMMLLLVGWVIWNNKPLTIDHSTAPDRFGECVLILAGRIVVNAWSPCPCHVVAPAILQSFDCASVFAPRLLCCACSFLLQCCKAFLVQLARPRKHSISYAVFVRSFFAVLFIVSFRAGRSMIERCLQWIKAWFSVNSV